MKTVDTIEKLQELYDAPLPSPVNKVQRALTPNYKTWISRSRFVVLATVGLEGTDASPRGDIGPVARIADDKTLLLPDWRGNNRLDSLRNIVREGRVSLMFMAPGCFNVIRVNGRAVLSDDPSLTSQFLTEGKTPRTVAVVTVQEVCFQCAKAFMRSVLWTPDSDTSDLPTAGTFIREFTEDFDARSYDDGYSEYARHRMW